MDFPLFRLAEANLTFAEATLRAGGDKQAALSAINQLRKRAKATEITATDLTLDFVPVSYTHLDVYKRQISFIVI